MALTSMTGFARADGQAGDYSWTWEVKSVNGRNLDIRCRIPPGFEAIEQAARRRAAEHLRRGSLSMNLQVNRSGAQATYRVNRTLLGQLATIVDDAKSVVDADPPRIDGLLALRGVIEIEEPEESEDERAARDTAIVDSLVDALKRLAEARSEEGGRLQAILTDQLDQIGSLTEKAAATAAMQPDAVKQRLTDMLSDLLQSTPALSEERLAQEIALLATKADVREELDRLRAHLAAGRELVENGGPDGTAGRRLDFLAQEFNREANTLCSKSQDVELTALGLELKVTIDRVREQVQNIE